MINGLGLGHYLRAPATLLPCWLGLCEGASQYAILGHPHLLALLPNRSSVSLPLLGTMGFFMQLNGSIPNWTGTN